MPVAIWATQESSIEYLMTSSKTVKLQTREIHQTETAILIPSARDAPNSKLEIFSTSCSPNSETECIIC